MITITATVTLFPGTTGAPSSSGSRSTRQTPLSSRQVACESGEGIALRGVLRIGRVAYEPARLHVARLDHEGTKAGGRLRRQPEATHRTGRTAGPRRRSIRHA